MTSNQVCLKERFVEAVIKAGLDTLENTGVVVTLKEFICILVILKPSMFHRFSGGDT